MIDVLQLLREINETLHKWDEHVEEYVPKQEALDWHAKRKALTDAGYELYEVDVWDEEGNEIIRRDHAIAPRMEAS